MQRNGIFELPGGSICGVQALLIAAATLTPGNSLWAQCPVAELVGSDASPWEHFGKAVATSADGGVILIGAPRTWGETYLFVREESGYVELLQLIPADREPDDVPGNAVALSHDGATALMTMSDDDADHGVGYVFVQRGETWTEQATLLPPEPPVGAGFGGGEGVALSADGNTAVIGAFLDDQSAENAGAAHVFVRNPQTSEWTYQDKLIASDGDDGDWFGNSVAICGDGNVVVAGTDQDDGGTGSAYVFVRDPKTSRWFEQIKLTASDAEPIALFGSSVAISADGETILVGAADDDEQAVGAGAAYVFVRDGKSWFEQAKLTALDGSFVDQFGSSVALSADGDRAVIGALHATSGLGAAYFFARNGSTWTQESKFGVCDGESLDLFGERVDISADGQTALVGSRWRDIEFINQGAAYVYDLDLDPASCADADITGDGQVGIDDLLWLLGSWGPCTGSYVCRADLNGDCDIGVADLLILLGSWG